LRVTLLISHCQYNPSFSPELCASGHAQAPCRPHCQINCGKSNRWLATHFSPHNSHQIYIMHHSINIKKNP
jgi:hypothetical protein